MRSSNFRGPPCVILTHAFFVPFCLLSKSVTSRSLTFSAVEMAENLYGISWHEEYQKLHVKYNALKEKVRFLEQSSQGGECL